MTTPPTTPHDILTLAESLVGGASPEAVRAGCDRAYYAAFLFCRDHLRHRGLFNPSLTAGDHQALAAALRRSEFAAGNDLHRLRRSRNQYTYNLNEIRQDGRGVIPPQRMLDLASRVMAAAAKL